MLVEDILNPIREAREIGYGRGFRGVNVLLPARLPKPLDLFLVVIS